MFDLTACDGPPCPARRLPRFADHRAADRRSFAQGLAFCNYCGRQFHFAPPANEAPDATTSNTAAAPTQAPAKQHIPRTYPRPWRW